MKKYYFLGISLFLVLACSKDAMEPINENPGEEVALQACFEISSLTLNVGEMLQITNCSEGATSYLFDFGNGKTSEAENPSINFGEGGTYTILLTITNDKEETATFSKSVTVQVVEALYLFPEIPEGFTGFPLETGINPVTGNIYSIEIYQDNTGPLGSKFYYREFDENYMYASTYIADKPYNSASAFMNIYPDGDKNFVFARTLGGLYGTQEVNYNSTWAFINAINDASSHSYGFLQSGSNYLYYGTQEDAGIFKASVEARNSSGDSFEVVLHNFGPADAMIGDMIAVTDGYIAFGAVFTKNVSLPYVSNYKPLLIFMDASLNVTSHVIFEDTELTSQVSSFNDLNGSYHLEQLSSGALVMYANGELLVTDATGNTVSSTFFSDTENNQALVALDDSFIISTDLYLRKYNASGAVLNEIKYNGNYMPELLKIENTLFFVAGYDVESEVKLFYGACDFDLTLIDLRP